MKVLVTGATGLVGKEALEPLQKNGLSVVSLSSKNFNLMDKDNMEAVIKQYKAEYLIHFAWITGGDYLTNPVNEALCKNSFELLKMFYKYGGKKAVFSGTCFEYEFSDSKLSEDSPLNPKTLYAQKKAELNDMCSDFCAKHSLDWAWGRIFYVCGHNEKEGRLTSSIVKSLLKNEKVTVKFGQLVRDYIYTKDIASAFAKLLLSDVNGSVNICTGRGISLESYAQILAENFSRQNLLEIHREETSQPVNIIGSNKKLIDEVGYNLQYDIKTALGSIAKDYLGNNSGAD